MPMHFPEAMITARADRAACNDLIRDGSKTFFAASHLLPRNVREPAIALYAFCRLADDAVDLQQDGRLAAVARLRDRLDRVYRGQPLPLSADRAFAETVRKFGIARALPEALIEGLEWDAQGRRFETLSELRAYAARVAGSVGAMMAVIMGIEDASVIARACDLGTAMQLTNIARDIGEDARNGRIYLPLEWMRDIGLDPETWLAAPAFSPEIGLLTARLLDEAARLYKLGEAGIASLPLACRPGIRAARLLYAEIGVAVAAQGHDSVSARAFVPLRRKLELLFYALLFGSRAGDLATFSAQVEARFLVEAVEARPPAAPKEKRTVSGQVIWALELFNRAEERRRALQSGV